MTSGNTRPKKPPRGARRPTPAPVSPRARFDWHTIEREYVEGIEKPNSDERWYPTYKELHERHGVGAQTIRERGAAGRWTEKRNAYQIQVAHERQKKHAKTLAKNAVEFDERTYQAAEIGVKLIATRLAEIAKDVPIYRQRREEALQKQAAGQSVEKWELYGAVNYREMEGLASALDRLQNVGQRALGTDGQKIEVTGDLGHVQVVNVHQEIVRDDPERVAKILEAMVESGMAPPELLDNIVDAEVVDEDEEDEDEQLAIEG